jgi:hypothetical protein
MLKLYQFDRRGRDPLGVDVWCVALEADTLASLGAITLCDTALNSDPEDRCHGQPAQECSRALRFSL